jgi:hypothetical protein
MTTIPLNLTPWDGDDPGASLDAAAALQVLNIGLKGPQRPVDDLIRRMRQFDGSQWFNICLTMLFSKPSHDLVAAEPVALDQLVEMKEKSKTMVAEASSSNESREALARYCACVAAALCMHKVSISSRPVTEWIHLFVEIADAAPPNWRPLFEDAAVVLQNECQSDS